MVRGVMPHSPLDLQRSGRDVGENLMAATSACPWSPTGKPVVPNDHTRLRQSTLKRFGSQASWLRRVIRPAAKSAEAW